VQSEAEATETVREIVQRLQARRLAISDAPLVRRLLQPLAADVELVNGAAKADLFKCDIGVTGAQWAIAETGTLALESDVERHRLASLVPPVHVAIVEEKRLRQTLLEVLQAIDEQGRDLSRTITFITGPSRTSDIELTLAIGVHGPAELHVIVLTGAK
jgi:L-lactate dehydrogenase complex protein LldG